ncbi:hypothetical protein [Halorussus aquaticus]|uniref:MYXO-CTERM domain-containing protein n=1 Tax=Halorussus aquaticus TaxID=2953748 RepID=A0ABD5Q287_9EURY|nr:hypothetical protein [Halorussus aquaticus]
MAIVEINLKKPALVEEYRYPGETSEGTQSSATHSSSDSKSTSDSKSSGDGKGKLLGLLALVAAVGVLVWKRKSGGSGGESEEEYEHGPEPEIGGDESGGPTRKVASALGLVVAVATLGAAVRKRRR